jgi:hypothetical protein
MSHVNPTMNDGHRYCRKGTVLDVRPRSALSYTCLPLCIPHFAGPLGTFLPIAVCSISRSGSGYAYFYPYMIKSFPTIVNQSVYSDTPSSAYQTDTRPFAYQRKMPIMSPHIMTAFTQFIRMDNEIKRQIDGKTRARTSSITRVNGAVVAERPRYARRSSSWSDRSV